MPRNSPVPLNALPNNVIRLIFNQANTYSVARGKATSKKLANVLRNRTVSFPGFGEENVRMTAPVPQQVELLAHNFALAQAWMHELDRGYRSHTRGFRRSMDTYRQRYELVMQKWQDSPLRDIAEISFYDYGRERYVKDPTKSGGYLDQSAVQVYPQEYSPPKPIVLIRIPMQQIKLQYAIYIKDNYIDPSVTLASSYRGLPLKIHVQTSWLLGSTPSALFFVDSNSIALKGGVQETRATLRLLRLFVEAYKRIFPKARRIEFGLSPYAHRLVQPAQSILHAKVRDYQKMLSIALNKKN